MNCNTVSLKIFAYLFLEKILDDCGEKVRDDLREMIRVDLNQVGHGVDYRDHTLWLYVTHIVLTTTNYDFCARLDEGVGGETRIRSFSVNINSLLS